MIFEYKTTLVEPQRFYAPNQQEIDFAKYVVQACDPVPVYARVDVISDNNGDLCVVELELIEPEMWFRSHPKSAVVFANQVTNFIKAKKAG